MQSYAWSSTIALVLVAQSACGGEREPQAFDDEGIVVESADADEVADGSDGDDGGGDEGPPPMFDAGNGNQDPGMAEGGDNVPEEGCQKVDLLFVIDNSGSMEDEQGNLINSFPGFIEEIQTHLADANGYHIGIISTDAYEGNLGCDEQEGALIVATAGDGSSEAVCGPFAEGYNFMTEADDLDVAFSCAAQIGIDGDGNERGMQTMKAALSESMNGPGGCNEGFLRDDALLVIVVITDEEDDHEIEGCADAESGSAGDPAAWFGHIIAAKGGQQEAVVMLSLIGPPGPDPAECPLLDKCVSGVDGAEPALRIAELTGMFTHGFVGRVCEASYADFFSEAVSVIETACEEFEPIQ